ncbi:hypothetical protein MKW98_029393 [Papaver atlanticum]|uniref:Eukaryotic translation initiation factor 3 subunit D n=1 Tax=Papaver atlanticum TaxID=357466 RepID=A0AAD4SJJ5_9MAGN|nr:hypothetical protein MKW98_029393 [Papaver atlanticum]
MLETQRGAVLATELKNNANKLAKWTAQALLASADMMKLGYVSRVHPRDHFNHSILSVVGYKPKEFATQINLNTNNMWGIVKPIVDLCMKLKEGKYVLVKDPSNPQKNNTLCESSNGNKIKRNPLEGLSCLLRGNYNGRERSSILGPRSSVFCQLKW